MTHRILVPVDESAEATAALEHAVEFYPDAEITLLHVIEYTEKKTSLKRGGRGQGEGWYAAKREEATELLGSVRDAVDGQQANIDTAIEDGDPANEIVAYANDQNIDAIVMGIRQRSPTGKVLFGSTAQSVLLTADCPVVAVPKTGN